jgi:hypothetical protein
MIIFFLEQVLALVARISLYVEKDFYKKVTAETSLLGEWLISIFLVSEVKLVHAAGTVL